VCLSAKFSNLRAKNNANIVLVGILNLAHLIDVGQSLAPNHFVVYNELLSGIYNTLNNNTVPHTQQHWSACKSLIEFSSLTHFSWISCRKNVSIR
jgi:hypothetical protein